MKIGTFSKGIYKTPNLKHFFSPNALLYFVKNKREMDLIITWGNKDAKASKYAIHNNTRLLKIEDGFIRSLAPRQYPILSIVKDDLGIYYDSNNPSQLEKIIISNTLSHSMRKRCEDLISIIRNNKISKYNHAPCRNIGLKKYVLVVDQTYNDLSINGAQANKSNFHRMLQAAINENPNSEIIIKTHPEVMLKMKKGYLNNHKDDKFIVYDQEINPWSLLENATVVYTVSSQLGFEALMAGKKVRCFGLPFYAGWGLTEDELTCQRRSIKRSLEDIFHSAYINYSTYLNPFTFKICDLEDVLPIMIHWKNINNMNCNISDCMGIKKWKRKTVERFIYSTSNTIKHIKKISDPTRSVLVWCSKFKLPCNTKNLIRMEDGFIRSIGLGAHFNQPQSLVIDFRGIYYDATQPSDLEHLIDTTILTNNNLLRARNIIEQLITFDITKYNIKGDASNIILPKDKKIILIVGQVEDDASIKYGSIDIKTNLALIKAVRANNNSAYIIYKPHPDVISNLRHGRINPNIALEHIDIIVENISITELINLSDELHTICSLSGFEALIRGKEVFCYGIPFYAGYGLTIDVHKASRRRRVLSIEELVYVALILYPRYIDPVTNLWCELEVIIDRFHLGKSHVQYKNQFLRKFLARLKYKLSQYA